jgi:hypothetical protein
MIPYAEEPLNKGPPKRGRSNTTSTKGILYGWRNFVSPYELFAVLGSKNAEVVSPKWNENLTLNFPPIQ